MSPQESESAPRPRRSRTNHRRSPVMGYLVILFAVAFLLLLWAYFQQQRSNAESTDALKQGVSAVQSIQNLMDENKALREENEALKEQVDTLEQENKTLDEAYTQAGWREETLIKELTAAQYMFRLDRLYRAQRFQDAAEMVLRMSALEPLTSLSDQPVSDDPNEVTPKSRYEQICKQLVEWNYLKKDEAGNLS